MSNVPETREVRAKWEETEGRPKDGKVWIPLGT
jgi:ubiquitin carboxyl-terminal hydrolase L3